MSDDYNGYHYAGLDPTLPVFSQLPDGHYIAFMDPGVTDWSAATSKEGARFCVCPERTCLKPSHTGVVPPRDSLDLIKFVEPELAHCQVFQSNLKHRLKEIPMRTNVYHLMVHWRGASGTTHHAYLVGPLFHQSDVTIIDEESQGIYPRLRRLVHWQDSPDETTTDET